MTGGWWARHVGTAFSADGAGDGDGPCHCWGLVRRLYRQHAGIDLPAYGELSASELVAASRAFRIDSAAAPWLPVVGPYRPLGVVVMAGRPEEGARRAPIHCGAMVDDRRLIHIEAASAAVVVPLTHFSVGRRVVAAYRHEALA
jgi:hypothetical protein